MTTISLFQMLATSPVTPGSTAAGAFETQVYDLIEHNEKFVKNAYSIAGAITIGDGYNMQAQPYATDFLTVDSGYTGTYVDTAALNSDEQLLKIADGMGPAGVAALATLHSHYTLTPNIRGSAWALSILALNRILQNLPINQTRGSAVSYDSTQLIIPASYELAAVEDLAYHSPILIGNTIATDLSSATFAAASGDWLNAWTDRAEAWHEIVFYSNRSFVASEQLRQFIDGEEFGLYSLRPAELTL